MSSKFQKLYINKSNSLLCLRKTEQQQIIAVVLAANPRCDKFATALAAEKRIRLLPAV
jgi:hypothetical protein